MKIKIPDHDKYTTTQVFNELTSEYFAVRVKQADLGSKNYIADLIRKTDFDEKLRKISNNVTLNKTRHKTLKRN